MTSGTAELLLEAQALGAAMLADSRDAEQLARLERLDPHTFLHPPNRTLHEGIRRLLAAGQGADPSLLIHDLTARGELEQAGGVAYLSELQDAAGTAANLEWVLDRLEESARRRGVRDVAQRLQVAALDPSRDVEELLTDAALQLAAPALRNGKGSVAPLFDLDASRFGRFLASPPPVRRWIFRQILPLGIVALFAAQGGAGKSMALYQWLLSVASGWDPWGFEVGEPGAVLYLAAEDDEEELHRRGRVLLEHHERIAQEAGVMIDREALASRLHVVSRVGEDNLLTRTSRDGGVVETPLGDRLVQTAKQIPNLRLIAVDTKNRFDGGSANSEEDASRFIGVAERVVKETGATFLLTAHINQTGVKEGGGQEIVRGSTALVDNVRWVATLQVLRRDQAADYGLQPDEARHHLRLEVPKSNYTAPYPGLWLHRGEGGVLAPTDLERVGGGRERKAESEYFEIVTRLQALLRERGPMTRNALRKHCVTDGPLGASDKTVRPVVDRALREKYILEIGGKLQSAPEEVG